MFEKLIKQAKEQMKTMVFTEGTDKRILEATSRLLAEDLMKVILVGNEAEVKKLAADNGFNIDGATIIDPAAYEHMDEMVDSMVELRKGKMSPEECREALQKGNYFGTMLVKMGKADCLLGGATYSTADTIRPALQLVKTKPGTHLVSSCFILNRDFGPEELRTICMGDCAVNLDYTDNLDKEGNVVFSGAQKLAEVIVECANCAGKFGIDPKVAVLSFSTNGSGKGGTVEFSREATRIARE
ncbi:MAG TPA: phosphate acyltransferase, partial [Bacillota bacterium]|nr:phosphate acyltransferase [Bacillota bacterium]